MEILTKEQIDKIEKYNLNILGSTQLAGKLFDIIIDAYANEYRFSDKMPLEAANELLDMLLKNVPTIYAAHLNTQVIPSMQNLVKKQVNTEILKIYDEIYLYLSDVMYLKRHYFYDEDDYGIIKTRSALNKIIEDHTNIFFDLKDFIDESQMEKHIRSKFGSYVDVVPKDSDITLTRTQDTLVDAFIFAHDVAREELKRRTSALIDSLQRSDYDDFKDIFRTALNEVGKLMGDISAEVMNSHQISLFSIHDITRFLDEMGFDKLLNTIDSFGLMRQSLFNELIRYPFTPYEDGKAMAKAFEEYCAKNSKSFYKKFVAKTLGEIS